MKKFRADLHIHTVLSPCGDLDMSPVRIVEQAKLMGLDIIGITDHNSTKHAKLISQIAEEEGLFTLCGAEITSKEEAHLLCFMPNFNKLELLQSYIEDHLIKMPNNTKYFGEQLIVNKDEEILEEEEFLLINAIDKDINEIADFIFLHQGIFIPAHVNRQAYSLTSQLGFIPPDLTSHALEISKHTTVAEFVVTAPYLKNCSFIKSSDAHFIPDIGSSFTNFHLMKLDFDEIKMALKKENGRFCETPE